jgi:hypothetical protein
LNPLRAQVAEAGINLNDLLAEGVEELNLEDIATIPEAQPSELGVVSVPAATAGFLPKDVQNALIDVAAMDPETWATWVRNQPGGQTGASVTMAKQLRAQNNEGIDFVRVLMDDAYAKGREALKARQWEDAMMLTNKGQYFREIVEAATETGGFTKKTGTGFERMIAEVEAETAGALPREPDIDSPEVTKALGDIAEMTPFARSRLLERARRARRFFPDSGRRPDELNLGLALQYLYEQGANVPAGGQALPRATQDALRRRRSPRTVNFPRTISGILENEAVAQQAINALQTGESTGATLTPAGYQFPTPVEPSDIVTLASVNVPVNELTPASIKEFAQQYPDVLRQPGAAIGMFALESQPGMVSIDINAVVPKKFRENTLAFAKANNQESVFDFETFDTVDTGGTGETVLTDPAELATAFEALREGRPVDVGKGKTAGALPRQPEWTKSNLTSWILPDGTLERVTDTHEDWLARRSQELNAKFKTKFSDKADVKEREKALKKGFVRIREFTGGLRPAVEVHKNAWTPGLRERLYDLLAPRIDELNGFTINVLNDRLKVVAGDTANNLFSKTRGQRREILDSMLQETPNSVPGAFLPRAEQGILPGIDIGPKEGLPTVRAAIEKGKSLPPKELVQLVVKAHADAFPEALPLTPRFNKKGEPIKKKGAGFEFQHIPYDIVNAYRAKEAIDAANIPENLPAAKKEQMRREIVSDELAKRLREQHDQSISDPRVSLAKNWYNLAENLIKRVFKDDFMFFAELIASTSSKTGVRENFLYALDAYNQFKEGKFDDIIAKTKEIWDGLNERDPKFWEPFLASLSEGSRKTAHQPSRQRALRNQALRWHIANNALVPKRKSGANYGINGFNVALALSRVWNELSGGPKTAQFTYNLAGTDLGPTIDVWVARTASRLLNEGNPEPWRILAGAEIGVSDVDFDVIADAYRKVADDLGLEPRQLQAMLWFGEKLIWDKQGWTKGAGKDLTSFVEMLEVVRSKKTGELIVQPEPGKEIAGLDLTIEEAKQFNVLPEIEGAPIEDVGLPKLIEPQLQEKLRKLGVEGI